MRREEKESLNIGAKTLDAGDIIQTLLGWTVIGYGESKIERFSLFGGGGGFRDKSNQTNRAVQAMDAAVSEISTHCNPKDASRAMYLITAPAREINMDMIKAMGAWIRDMAPNAIIRNGDYPRDGTNMNVTVILSELSDVAKVRKFYTASTDLVPIIKQRQQDVASKLQSIDDLGKDIPTLL